MKRLLHSVTVIFRCSGGFLCAISAASASDEQTLDPAENNSANEPILLAQNASPKEEKSSNTAAINVDSKGVILKGYDAVAYFKQGKPLKGNPTIESTYQGVTYLFASAANKADFDKDPAKYVPRYGGFCAYGVANGVISGHRESECLHCLQGQALPRWESGRLKKFQD